MRSKYVYEWIKKAEQDYQTVLLLARQKKKFLPDIICFHAHQFVEKYLKALLAKHKYQIPKTHDLIYLLDLIKKDEADLELLRDIFRNLNRYAVSFRYPGEGATRSQAR